MEMNAGLSHNLINPIQRVGDGREQRIERRCTRQPAHIDLDAVDE